MLNKVDRSGAYMGIWVLIEDTPPITFLVPRATPEEEQLVVFHLSILVGYVEYAAFL